MLSKSAARAFFLLGTLLCSGAFIWLTVDTLAQVPEITRQENLTPAAIRGKHLWDVKNCMGCHTLLGEGAYYAPELTKVYSRRGPEFIRAMLTDPEAVYPGQRKMVRYELTPREMDDLVEFFKWIDGVNLNGFPPAPTINAAAGVATADDKTPLVFKQICSACHAINGEGGKVGPALDDVGKRFDAAYLERWLRNPRSIKPNTTMPQLPLTDAQVTELIAFFNPTAPPGTAIPAPSPQQPTSPQGVTP